MQTNAVLGLLGVAFVVLKLNGTIDWSWWLVLLPFYGAIAVFVAVAVTSLVIMFMVNGGRYPWRK